MTLVVIDQEEVDFRLKDVTFTADDVTFIIEHKEIIKKRLKVAEYKYRSWLANMNYVDKEKEVYTAVNILAQLASSLEETTKTYRDYQTDLKKKNQEKMK